MRNALFVFAIGSFFLTACGSNPQSYLPVKSKPIVNIESPMEQFVEVNAKADALTLENKTDSPISSTLKFFWYDQHGATQSQDAANEGWQPFYLPAKSLLKINLIKPTPESENYRIYLRKNVI